MDSPFLSISVEEIREDFELLPEDPGVYAWFLRFDQMCSSSSAIEIAALLDDHLDKPTSSYFNGMFGTFFEGKVRSRSGRLPPGKTEQLKVALSSASSRNAIVRSLTAAKVFQAPLYVGKADNLRKRVLAHLSDSDLSQRIKVAGWRLEDCEVRYIPIPESIMTDNLHVLIEDILTRLCRPGFVHRIG